MRQKSPFFWLLIGCLLPLAAGLSFSQANDQAQFARRFRSGMQLYELTRWHEAAAEFRRAQETAENTDDWSSALYWVILSELAYTDYGSALRDMEELERIAYNSTYARDMVYHRARVYYNQGFFEDALFLFNRYNTSVADVDRVSSDRRAASFFWMGECLYSMGQYDEAEKFYAWVISRYPGSPKNEAASYRIDLIVQKKIETELLALLQWSHEESLRSSEDYQRKIRTYEYTLNLYQRRIAELSGLSNPNEIREIPSPGTAPENAAPEPPPVNVPGQAPEWRRPGPQGQNGLIDRAMQLGSDVQQLLKDNQARGYW